MGLLRYTRGAFANRNHTQVLGMPMKLKVGPPVKSGTQDEEGLYPLEAQPCIGKRVGHGR